MVNISLRMIHSIQLIQPNTSELVAKVSKATKDDVDNAFESLNKAYDAWRKWSHKDRELMLRVAAIIRRRKEEISVMVYEAGKPWDEAVGDAVKVLIL